MFMMDRIKGFFGGKNEEDQPIADQPVPDSIPAQEPPVTPAPMEPEVPEAPIINPEPEAGGEEMPVVAPGESSEGEMEDTGMSL